MALLAFNTCQNAGVDLTFVRQSKQELAPTVMRHMLMRTVREAVAKGVRVLRFVDPISAPGVIAALEEVGFRPIGGGWLKPVLSGFVTRHEIAQRLDWLEVDGRWLEKQCADEIESFIWPAKLKSEEIPCYLIPIRAEWAEHFFDTELAAQRLPGMTDVREDLHLGVEATYYSSSNISMRAPGRILWYVSQGNEKFGSMQVKACSRLREVVHDGPKALFKRFRRLGVYAWKDIYDLAGKNVDKELTALRFSHTERFPQPLNAEALRAIGVSPPYPGPRPIPHSTFVSIYNQANPIQA